MATTLQVKFNQLFDQINSAMIGRDQEIELILTAMVCKEHVFMHGTYGIGKTMVAEAVAESMGSSAFTELMTNHTKPEDIFGPADVNALKNSENRVITDGMLPDANIAVLDELFKAPPSILNTLLRILNERKFKNGKQERQCDLYLCIAASNEWPDQQRLGALFDRFLFRKHVEEIEDEDMIQQLMFSKDVTPQISVRLTKYDINDAHAEATALDIPDEVRNKMAEIRREARNNGIMIGNRRIRKSVLAVQASAWLRGASCVEIDDLGILGHIWWSDPNEHPEKVQDIIADLAKPARSVIRTLVAQAKQVADECDGANLEQAVPAITKLSEIAKKIGEFGTQEADNAKEEVKAMMKQIRSAVIPV